MKRIALIIAGGSGERFWPLSRKDRPKQLLKITDSGRVMLDDTVHRVERIFGIENVFIVTGEHLVDPIREEIPELSAHILAEPDKRNTAGAILWGMGVVSALLNETDLTFAVFPADHMIRPAQAFEETVLEALDFAEEDNRLVTIGITPTRPETGYGYIERGARMHGNCSSVERFIEKPDLPTAEKLLKTGKVFWNGGMFFWTLKTFLSEIAKASPAHHGAFSEIVSSLKQGRTVVAEIAFGELPDIAIDRALMERSPNVGLVEARFEWDDVGAWDALERVLESDSEGNALFGNASVMDSCGCIVHNSGTQTVKLLGVKDLVVVVTPEAILVCPKDRAQEVKKLAGD